MKAIKERIDAVLDSLTVRDQLLLLEIAERFIPDRDDIATLDDLEDIAEARREYLAGESLSESDIDWS